MAIRCLHGVLLAAALLHVGCKTGKQICDPEYLEVAQATHRAYQSPAPELEALPPVYSHLEGPQPVEVFIQQALGQNPEIHTARNQMEAAAYQVPVAASLPDPMLNLTVQPEPVQTAAGQQDATLSVSQKFFWLGKLDAKANAAEANTNVARAQLSATELETIAQVKRAYYELYYVQQALAVTEQEQGLLSEIREIANTRYQTGGTSQQDVLRADLEISNIENELIRLRQQLESTQARLARLIHVAPQTNVMTLDRLSAEQAPRDLQRLQEQAVAARPELHAQLAAIQREQHNVELARLDYKPDVTLGFSWIAVADQGVSPVTNGRDAFLLTAGVNLPVYRKRLEAQVRSAQAKAVATASEYDSLRDATLEEVTDLFAQARSQQDMLMLFREAILPRARQTLEVSSRAYNVGEVDFLQLLDNFRQLLRYEVSYRRTQATYHQTLAELERVVGGYAATASATPPLPEAELLPEPNP